MHLFFFLCHKLAQTSLSFKPLISHISYICLYFVSSLISPASPLFCFTFLLTVVLLFLLLTFPSYFPFSLQSVLPPSLPPSLPLRPSSFAFFSYFTSYQGFWLCIWVLFHCSNAAYIALRQNFLYQKILLKFTEVI